MTAHNPVEITGNLIVHHPVKDPAELPATTIVPVISPKSWTPAPQVCRHCRTVQEPVQS